MDGGEDIQPFPTPASTGPVCLFYVPSKLSTSESISSMLQEWVVDIFDEHAALLIAETAKKMAVAREKILQLRTMPNHMLTIDLLQRLFTNYIQYVDSLIGRISFKRSNHEKCPRCPGGVLLSTCKHSKFTEEEIVTRLGIKWKHCFLLTEEVSIRSLKVERGCMLFNMASLLSFHALKPLEAVPNNKSANEYCVKFFIAQTRAFRCAAGMFSQLIEYVTEHSTTMRSIPEFRNTDMLLRFKLVMLAQAQQTFYYVVMRNGKVTDEILAQIAQLCSQCYSDVSNFPVQDRIFLQHTSGNNNERDDLARTPALWNCYCCALSKYFNYVAIWHMCRHQFEKDPSSVGQIIVHLSDAKKNLAKDHNDITSMLTSPTTKNQIRIEDKEPIKFLAAFVRQEYNAFDKMVIHQQEYNSYTGKYELKNVEQIQVAPSTQRLEPIPICTNLFTEDSGKADNPFEDWIHMNPSNPSASSSRIEATPVRQLSMAAATKGGSKLDSFVARCSLYELQRDYAKRISTKWKQLENEMHTFISSNPSALLTAILYGAQQKYHTFKDSLIGQLLSELQKDQPLPINHKNFEVQKKRLTAIERKLKSAGQLIGIKLEEEEVEDEGLPTTTTTKREILCFSIRKCKEIFLDISSAFQSSKDYIYPHHSDALLWLTEQNATSLFKLVLSEDERKLWNSLLSGADIQSIIGAQNVAQFTAYKPNGIKLYMLLNEIKEKRLKYGAFLRDQIRSSSSQTTVKCIQDSFEAFLEEVEKLAYAQTDILTNWPHVFDLRSLFSINIETHVIFDKFWPDVDTQDHLVIIYEELFWHYPKVKSIVLDNEASIASIQATVDAIYEQCVEFKRTLSTNIIVNTNSLVPPFDAVSLNEYNPQEVMRPPLDSLQAK